MNEAENGAKIQIILLRPHWWDWVCHFHAFEFEISTRSNYFMKKKENGLTLLSFRTRETEPKAAYVNFRFSLNIYRLLWDENGLGKWMMMVKKRYHRYTMTRCLTIMSVLGVNSRCLDKLFIHLYVFAAKRAAYPVLAMFFISKFFQPFLFHGIIKD